MFVEEDIGYGVFAMCPSCGYAVGLFSSSRYPSRQRLSPIDRLEPFLVTEHAKDCHVMTKWPKLSSKFPLGRLHGRL